MSTPPSHFPDTRWTLLDAIRGRQEGWFEALSEVCNIYWYPVYAFFRDDRKRHHDAQDLTQGLFELVLDGDELSNVDQAKGNFRAFLSAAARNYARNERAMQNRQKRGGGKVLTGFDERLAKKLYSQERLVDNDDPQVLYDRRWALALIARVLDDLRKEQESAGKGDDFKVMVQFLEPNAREEPYAKAAKKLGKSEAAMRVAVFRLRARFGELLRFELAQLVSPQHGVIEDEIRHLIASLKKGTTGTLGWLTEQ